MLKNEVKKTTTRPPWPSALQTGPKWTTHSASVKLCIKEILEYTQTANKPPSASQHAFCACFYFSKQRSPPPFFKILALVFHPDKNKL